MAAPRQDADLHANHYDSYASSKTYIDSNYPPSTKLSSAGYSASNNNNAYPPPFIRERFAASEEHLTPTMRVPTKYGQEGHGLVHPHSSPYQRGRSPSPTPSELQEMENRGIVDWKKLLNWRTYAKVKYIPWYIVLVVTLVLVALMTLYHEEIVRWLEPAANWMHDFKFGWLIVIAVLFVLSFPPLFGHEIVGVLCGLVWGLWVGFAVFSAGTLLGEIGNFYAFRYCCSSRGEKLEKQKFSYACLARVVRDGGFKIALAARLSAIPGHFTTAIFSTCGMGIFIFTLAAFLSLPKQFIVVYLGVILEQSDDSEAEKEKQKTSRLVSNITLAITFVITVAAGWWMWHRMNKARPIVLRERRVAKKKAAALAANVDMQYGSRPSNVDLESELTQVPLSENQGGWGNGGGYGYTGVRNTASPYGDRNKEEWQLSDSRLHPYSYQPSASRQRDVTDHSDDMTPSHLKITTDPPQLPHMELPTAKRTGRGWETSEGTVGMGSWGGILRESSEDSGAHLKHRAGHSPFDETRAPPPTIASHQPAPYHYEPPAYSPYQPRQTSASPPPSRLNEIPDAQKTGLGAFTHHLTTPGERVSLSSGRERKSVELRGNHAVGRSFRAVVEGPTDDGYSSRHDQQITDELGSVMGSRDPASFHTAREREISSDTFGARSLHSRESATAGESDDDGARRGGYGTKRAV